MSTEPIGIAQLLEIPAGDKDAPSWVNAPIRGIVADCERRVAKSGKAYWQTELSDTTLPHARICLTTYIAPKFAVGDELEIEGKGMRRTEFNGRQELALAMDKTTFHVLRSGAKAPPASAGRTPLPGHEPPPPPPFPSDPETPDVWRPAGATVGAALKAAFQTHLETHAAGIERALALETPDFWRLVHVTASDLLRVHRLLESGNLAESVRARAGTPAAAPVPPPPSAPRRPAAPAPANQDEDVPF